MSTISGLKVIHISSIPDVLRYIKTKRIDFKFSVHEAILAKIFLQYVNNRKIGPINNLNVLWNNNTIGSKQNGPQYSHQFFSEENFSIGNYYISIFLP